MKKRENVVVTASVGLFYEQVVSCHQDTQAPLFELAVDTAVETAHNYTLAPGEPVEVNVIDLENALEDLKCRADRQIARLRAAMDLRGEA